MDERLQFVARRLAGEPRAELCREFGISRKTGYKIFDRYQEYGVHGLTDRSRRPYRYANQLPFQVENYILNVKREHASWGARKIRERLTRRFSGIPIPAKSTIHAVLDRHGLVERRGRLRRRAQGTALSLGQRPNELWCTDYKGKSLLGNHQYCYPLTVTDHASRFILTCEALSSTRRAWTVAGGARHAGACCGRCSPKLGSWRRADSGLVSGWDGQRRARWFRCWGRSANQRHWMSPPRPRPWHLRRAQL